MLRITLLLSLFFFSSYVHGQFGERIRNGWVGRYVNSIINDTTSADKANLTIYPTFANAPETGIELGFSTLKLYYANGDTLNRLSEMQAFTFFTFKGQYGLQLENALYGDQDKWFFLGETKIQRFPLSYYGIGPSTSKENPATVDAFQISAKQRVLRKLADNFFAGPEVDFQLLTGVNFKQPEEGQPFDIPRGGEGVRNMGLGFGVVYDNRHNVLNVRDGLFGEIAYLKTIKGFVSEHDFGSFNLDVRSFHKVKENTVFAWQASGQYVHGEVPFNQLALLGGERLMRGYYLGRYRDRAMLAAQAEYRILPFSFSKRFGAAIFGSVGNVAPDLGSFQMRNTRVAGGVGLRFLLFPKKDIYLRFDLAFTREGANIYIFNGEAF